MLQSRSLPAFAPKRPPHDADLTNHSHPGPHAAHDDCIPKSKPPKDDFLPSSKPKQIANEQDLMSHSHLGLDDGFVLSCFSSDSQYMDLNCDVRGAQETHKSDNEV